MYGVFDIKIGVGDTEIPAVAFNHLTRAGMQYVLKGKPERIQSIIVPTTKNKIFTKTLNYMFFIVSKEKNSPDPIPDNEVYNLTFDNLPENIIWIDYGTTQKSLNMPLGETETVYIKGVGIGHKDIGGDEANNFIFSYANTDITVSNKRYDGASNGYKFWNFNANYTFTSYTNTQPAINVTLGDKTYVFKQSNITESIYGYTSDFTNYLGFSNWTGPNLSSMHSAKPAFYWWVCGRPGAAPEKFEELIVEDPITREMSRVFKVSYYNQRPFDIDITGFFYESGTRSFNYRSEIDNYIRVPAGKRLELTFAVDIAGGQLPPVNNRYFSFNTPPTTQGYVADGLMSHTYRIKVHAVQYEGTAKEKKLSYDDAYSLSNWFNDELTKVYYELNDGTFTAPTYVLGNKTPTSYSLAAPSIPTTDGWVINNAKFQFAITAPTGVTRVQFTTRDNVWETYTVTPGTTNYIDLPLRFLYENEMFIRWGNASTTGLITYYVCRLVNTTELIAIEPTLSSKTGQNIGVLAYPSRKALNLPWKYSDERQLVWNTLPLTAYTSAPYGPLNYSWSVGAKAIKIDDTVKWFNPVTRTLDAVPAFLQQHTSNYISTDNGWFDVYPDLGQPRAVQSTSTAVVPFNGTPRISDLVRVIGPTEAKPNSFKLYTLSGTRKVEIYNTDNNAIIKTLDVVPGTEYIVNILEPLYNHIYYGIRYLDGNGVNQSLGMEYLFKGIELAKPDDIRDLFYDIETKTLTFVTPARAKRATITRWGFELFSFECVENGETVLYTSEPLDTTGNYILTCYNANGLPNNVYYVFGEQPNDQPVLPDTTGHYSFSDWSPSSSDYSTSGAFPFMQLDHITDGFYNLEIDNLPARVIEVKKNPAGLPTHYLFEAGGTFLYYYTGYSEYDEDPARLPSGTSSVSGLSGGNGYIIVDVWHEWKLYATTGIDKLGIYQYGKWVPKYGKNTSWYQFSEINTGYVKNSARILLKNHNNSQTRRPYAFDSTLTAKTPYVNVFLQTHDIVGSYNFNSIPSNRSVRYIAYDTYINGVKATWDPTFAEDGDTVTKLRAVTDDVVFVFDTTDRSAGWVLEGFDSSLIGHADYKDVSYTFEIVSNSKYNWSNYLSTYVSSSGISNSKESATRGWQGYYFEQAFTRVYPYMELSTFEQATGQKLETQNYFIPNGSGNYSWSEAYLSGNIAGMLNNTTVLINGKVATITPKEVTLTYIPGSNDLISSQQYEDPVVTHGNNKVLVASEGVFTYTAHEFSIDGITISNDKHPKVLSIISMDKTYAQVDIVFVRNRILQPTYSIDYYTKTENVRVNDSIHQYSPYWYNYVAARLTPKSPKILKFPGDNGAWQYPDVAMFKPELSSIYIVKAAVLYGIKNNNFTVPEDATFVDLFKINGENFNLVLDSDWLTDFTAESRLKPWLTTAFKLTNANNTKEILFTELDEVTYTGFGEGKTLKLEISKFSTNANDELLSMISGLYDEITDSPVSRFINQSAYQNVFGYNASTFWNYVPHVIPSGKQGLKITLNTSLLSSTNAVENFTVPDRTEEVIERFNTTFNNESNLGLNSAYLYKSIDLETMDMNGFLENITFTCNDVLCDGISLDQDNGAITLTFTSLDVQLVFVNRGMYIEYISTGNALDAEELFVFKAITKGLDINNTLSPFVFTGEDFNDNDTPLYNAYFSNIGFYNDVNGNERYQTMYLLFGKKPYVEIEIDPRIGNSPYPEFGINSYTYSEIQQMEIPS